MLLNFLDCGRRYIIQILNPSNSRGLKIKLVRMHLLCLQRNGLIRQMLLELLVKQVGMVEHMRIQILHLNLRHGYRLNLNCISLKIVSMNSPYLVWDYKDPELAAAGTIMHGFEFLFVRLAPIFFRFYSWNCSDI